jgi:hypothetical protein
MTVITVTEALAELTLLQKRIESARAALENGTLITVVEVGKVPTGFKSREEYEVNAKALVQRVQALLDRRRAIKRAIVVSNASTRVTVAGEEMTVAEAIEMKNFIVYYEAILGTMQSAYTQTRNQYEKAQAKIKERLDKLALEVLGKNEAVNSDQYQSLVDSFMAREGVELLDPTNISKEIERRMIFIEEFKSTCDRVLSISNATTTVEIPESE